MKILAAFLGCALVLFGAPAFGQTYSFSILAGAPPPTGSQDGTGPTARFRTPLGIAVDGAGNVYVADRDNALIRKVSPSGVVSTLAGLAGSTGTTDGLGAQARFNQPVSVALDPAGNLFVSDRLEHTIRKVTPAGLVTTFAGSPGNAGSNDGTGGDARFREPYGVGTDSSGNVYVADSGNRTVRKITPDGTVTTLAGTPAQSGDADGTGAAARFNGLAGLAVDGSGNIYVVDIVRHVVRKITPAGVVTTFAGQPGTPGNTNGVGPAARFNTPFAVAVDTGGNVFVADTVNETLRRISTDGTVSNFAGSAIAGSANGTGADARFFRPQGIAVDNSGNVYVGDTSNHTIRKVTSSATSSTLAGGGGNFGSTDGTGPNARFNRPRGIGIDRLGNLYVSESFSPVVRRITPTGAVSTHAGSANAPLSYVDATGSAARFGFLYGLSVDANDNALLVDVIYNTVRRVTAAGVVDTLAGTPSLTPGSNDGGVGVGRLNRPQGVAADRDGNMYIADTVNHTIRKVTPPPGRLMTTFAGTAGTSGSADGAGLAARFNSPSALAVDGSGNIFVADYDNSTIRKITPSGVVTTFAGQAGSRGFSDGVGSAARFDNPDGIAIDGDGNLFVSDSNNHTIRKITPDGTVSTIAGQAGLSGVVEGTGNAARFFIPSNLTVDSSGAIYVVSAFGNVIMKGVITSPPSILTQPLSHTVLAGTSVNLSVGASGGGLAYQWKFNGVAIPGANSATYTIPIATPGNSGSYTVDITNTMGAVSSNAATITVVGSGTEPSRIGNLAIRSRAGTDAQTLIVGVAIGGSGTTGTKPVLLRGAGPTLEIFSVPGFLADPKLELYSGANKLSENDDWGGNAQVAAVAQQVGAFPYNSATSKDAALLFSTTSTPATYSMQIAGIGGTTGVALAEIYDATPNGGFTNATPRLTNVSARTQVGTGADILIAGFVISGQTSKNVLIRAIGPKLADFGVTGVLANPKLELYTGETKIDENDDWGGSIALVNAFTSVSAFQLSPTSQDAVLVVTLPPGGYTAQVRGASDTTGVALVEIYELP